MRMKTVLFGAAAASLAATPIVAQAARTAAPVDGESELAAGAMTPFLVLAVIAAVIFAGATIANDDEPSSP